MGPAACVCGEWRWMICKSAGLAYENLSQKERETAALLLDCCTFLSWERCCRTIFI